MWLNYRPVSNLTFLSKAIEKLVANQLISYVNNNNLNEPLQSAYKQCQGSCTVQYGGQYKSNDGFQQFECSGNIQSANNIGFWCDWSGDGSVMMIGGGGSACERADHGIGITEANEASFYYLSTGERDFGYHGFSAPSQSYSLNLWIH